MSKATDTFPPIRTLVPHAGPMVLLDQVLSADEENLCAEVTITAASLFYADDGVGAWVGVEYMAQAIAAHAGYLAQRDGAQIKVGFLLGARRYEAQVPAFAAGSVLHVHVHRALQAENGLGAFECRIELQGVTVAMATITVFQPADVNEFLEGSGTAV